MVTWTADDGNGQVVTCTQNVTIEDNEDPTITCPADITVSADAGVCEATGVALGSPTTSDNCPGETASNDAPASFPVGSTTVTWTVTDAAGNTAICTQTVTVTDDEAPVAVCQDITVELDGTGNASITPNDIDNGSSDNCGSVTLSLDNDSFDCSDMPVSNEGLIFGGAPERAEVGNVSFLNGATQATFEAWINLSAPPSAVRSMIISRDNSFELQLHASNGLGLRINNGSSLFVPFFPTLNQWYHVAAIYNAGNVDFYIDGKFTGSTTQASSIQNTGTNMAIGCRSGGGRCLSGTVDEVRIWNVARTPAEISANINNELTGTEAGLGAYYNMNDGSGSTIADDLVGSNDGTLTAMDPNTAWGAGTPSISGSGSEVNLTVTDAAGNVSTCIASVTVEDNEDPTITCPADVNVSTDAGTCEATGVALGSPTTSDNCAGETTSNDAPASFPVGSTTVTWTVTDASGNTAICTQMVTVTDNEDPTITCPADVNVSADAGVCEATGVALGSPTTSDNCPGETTTNDAPATFPTRFDNCHLDSN